MPSIPASFEDPLETVDSKASLTLIVLFSSTIFSCILGTKTSSIIFVPLSSLWLNSFIIWGWIKSPPFATAFRAVINWIPFIVLVCPKDIVAKSTAFISSTFLTIPVASPGKSTPDWVPDPKSLIYSFNFSAPNFSPISMKATLHEFSNVWLKFCTPCPPGFQHFIFFPATFKLPSQ